MEHALSQQSLQICFFLSSMGDLRLTLLELTTLNFCDEFVLPMKFFFFTWGG